MRAVLYVLMGLAGTVHGQITKNIVTDFGAACNNVANDIAAFNSFHSWALTWQATNSGLITLTVPSGSVCRFATGNQRPFAGITHLLVSGYGATFNDGGGAGSIWLGGTGTSGVNGHSARLATVAAGSSSVTLLTSAQAALFSVGTWALITGLDMQGYGYPQNPYYFEYVQITGISGGVVTFAAPLANSYLSTWPLYSAGSNLQPDEGGPATLYTLDSTWDMEAEYAGLTLTQTGQIYSPARSITYRDVTMTGSNCAIPSQNRTWSVINATMAACNMEADKLVDTMSLSGVTIRRIIFQSSSINTFLMTGSTVTVNITGAPKATYIMSSTIDTLKPGATAYGRTDSVSCLSCVISTMLSGGVEDGGNAGGVQFSYGLTDGILTSANANGPLRWAIPGTKVYWAGHFTSEGWPFVVNGVTQDATNTSVNIQPLDNFPNIPVSTVDGSLVFKVFPSPVFTCDCTGSAVAVDLSQNPGKSLWTYSKRTYAGNIGAGPVVRIEGSIVAIKINVTKAYTGALSTLNLGAMGQFQTNLLKPDGATLTYSPVINLKIAGERDIYPASVVGQQSGDSGLSLPSAVWMTSGFQPYLATNIGGEDPSVWPSLTIEVIANQNRVGFGALIH